MLERKLNDLLDEAKNIRQNSIENESANYYNDVFDNLSDFISKKLNNPLLKNKNAKIIVNHFDEILQYIVSDNMNILLLNIDLLIEQPNFKEKFIEGLKNYPYTDEIGELFYNIWGCLNSKNKFDNFIDSNILKTLSTMNLKSSFYSSMLNILNEENQKIFLNILA